MLEKLYKWSANFKKYYLKLFKNMEPKSMERVFVRSVPNENSMQIYFKYDIISVAGPSQPRPFNFNRPKSEELEKSLQRISASVSKEVNKKLAKSKKKKTALNVENIPKVEDVVFNAQLLDEERRPLNGQLENIQAWIMGSQLTIGDMWFAVEINSPSVASISLPNIIMTNFPVSLKLSLEFANEAESEITWFMNESKSSADEKFDNKKHEKNKRKSVSENWKEIKKGLTFIPSKEHLGCMLKVSCLPKFGSRTGIEATCLSKTVVCEGPQCPFEKRHSFTQGCTSENCFRIVSYNILADLYADSDYTREVLYPYCPPKFLDISYRTQLILKEIKGYNGDVLCLQEVDSKVFIYDLMPAMNEAGFDGLFKSKMGEMSEGCSLFYRKSKFRLIDSYDIGLADYLQTDSMRELLEKVSAKKTLLEKLMTRKTILQVTLLQDVSDDKRYVVVATTHLYFHPKAAHIRLIQMHICIQYLRKIFSQLKAEKNIEPSLVLCGDFNSAQHTGLHEYLLNGAVSYTHIDWISGGEEECITDLNLSHDFNLSNASGFPSYTNYVKDFNACLDYIYISKLHRDSVFPMPSHEDVILQQALPSQFFPSDHIAIGCDLTWTSQR